MIPTGIETCWNKVSQRKKILNNNSALVGINFYLIDFYMLYKAIICEEAL
jgi:hypothetical protein